MNELELAKAKVAELEAIPKTGRIASFNNQAELDEYLANNPEVSSISGGEISEEPGTEGNFLCTSANIIQGKKAKVCLFGGTLSTEIGTSEVTTSGAWQIGGNYTVVVAKGYGDRNKLVEVVKTIK